MPADPEIEKKEKGFIAHFFFWMAVGFVAVSLYVLSTGPVIKLLDQPGKGPSPTVLAIYAPLVWLSEKSIHFTSFMDWYVKVLWHVDR